MDETREAEKFNAELDRLIAGEDLEGKASRELKTAQLLLATDRSSLNRTRESLKTELLGRGEKAPRLEHPRMAVLAACAGTAMLLIGIFGTPKRIGNVAQEDSATARQTPPRIKQGEIFDKGKTGKSKNIGHPVRRGSVEMHPMEMASFRKLFRGDASSPRRGPLTRANIRTGKTPGYQTKGSKKGGVPTDILLTGVPRPKPEAQILNRMQLARGTKALGESLDFMRIARGRTTGIKPDFSPPQSTAFGFNTEAYDPIVENPFRKATDNPLSTFSIDVDAASYANARRFLNGNSVPPQDAVRIEEFINYFSYDYPEPKGEHPFSITTELSKCPWKPEHKLVHIGLKGKSIPKENLPPNNLVFLIDSSGSMSSPDKLPLLQKALRMLVAELRDEDRIAVVAYAGSAGLVLPSTRGSDKALILEAIDRLQAGGSTAGGAGIQLAYTVAAENLLKKGNNRVILATDGDFNIGVSSDGELVRMIEEKRGMGIFLTVLGFGTGNYKDAKMEKLADKGNGNYAYIDDILEAKKVLVQEMGATLFTIAKDVKLQIEFNPAHVQAYRLIGYENRTLAAEDFNDDKKDAGELGAGHTVTALYEIIPPGVKMDVPAVDELKYQNTKAATDAADSEELLTVKFRYKKPDEDKSKLIVETLADRDRGWEDASENHRFAAAAAGFGMLLRGSKYSGNLTYKKVREMASDAKGKDEAGYRAELIRLVEKAELLDQRQR